MYKVLSRLTKKSVDMFITVGLSSVTLDLPTNVDSVFLMVEWHRGTMVDYSEAVLVDGSLGETRSVELNQIFMKKTTFHFSSDEKTC